MLILYQCENPIHKSHHGFIFTIRAAVGIHQGILGFSSKMVDPSFSSQKTAFKNAGTILPGFGWEILLNIRPSIGYPQFSPQFSDNCWECDLWGIASHFHEQNAGLRSSSHMSDWKQCQHTFATTSHGEYGIICFGCDFIGLPTMGAIVDTTGRKKYQHISSYCYFWGIHSILNQPLPVSGEPDPQF